MLHYRDVEAKRIILKNIFFFVFHSRTYKIIVIFNILFISKVYFPWKEEKKNILTSLEFSDTHTN